MKWIFIGAGVVLFLGVGAYFILAGATPQETGGPRGSVTLPTAETTTAEGFAAEEGEPALTLKTQNNGILGVKDFLRNGETVADPLNKGFFLLAGSANYCLSDGTCPKGAPSENFSITYNQKGDFFNIVLLREPLGLVRRDAEAFLEERLGISGEIMCTLNYFVGVPYFVNPTFSDRNLGFSFCKLSTQLP